MPRLPLTSTTICSICSGNRHRNDFLSLLTSPLVSPGMRLDQIMLWTESILLDLSDCDCQHVRVEDLAYSSCHLRDSSHGAGVPASVDPGRPPRTFCCMTFFECNPPSYPAHRFCLEVLQPVSVLLTVLGQLLAILKSLSCYALSGLSRPDPPNAMSPACTNRKRPHLRTVHASSLTITLPSTRQ